MAYTDKGSGNGYHDLMSGVVTSREGLPMDAATAGTEALFRVRAPADRLAAFNTALPNRVAYKHAHSRLNPEKDWGQDTLSAVRFALYVLNQQYAGHHFAPANTLVIASSVSNGGGAALAAAEQDTEGLIDAVAVSEADAQPRPTPGVQIRQGSATVPVTGLPLIDYFTLAALYQPCALLSARTGLSMDPAFWPAAYATSAQQRCTGLAERGLVSGDTVASQADSAWDVLLAQGWTPESAFLQQSHFRLATNAIAVTYANALGRFGALDDLCGYSFANTDASGLPIAQSPTTQAGLFASGNGIAPTSGVNIVYDDSVGAPRLDFLSTSPSTGRADFGLDGALCLRALATGHDAVSGAPLSGDAAEAAARVRAGVAQVQLGARLHGKPTVIVAGQPCRSGLFRAQPAGRAGQPHPLHRGDQRPALRRLHVLWVAAGLRHPLHPAACVLQRGDGCGLGPPDHRRAAAGQPGGAHRAAGQQQHGAVRRQRVHLSSGFRGP